MANKQINLNESARDRLRLLSGTISADTAEDKQKQRLMERKDSLKEAREQKKKAPAAKKLTESDGNDLDDVSGDKDKDEELFEGLNVEDDEIELDDDQVESVEIEGEGGEPPMGAGDEEMGDVGGMADPATDPQGFVADLAEELMTKLAFSVKAAVPEAEIEVEKSGGESEVEMGGEGEEGPADVGMDMGEEEEDEMPAGLMENIVNKVLQRILKEVKAKKAAKSK